jgi:ATP-dependent DNA helicase PIF1
MSRWHKGRPKNSGAKPQPVSLRPLDRPSLSVDQSEALQVISKELGPFFVTGPAGCGKSFLIDEIRRGSGVEVCATTGIAAQLVHGMTVHSFLGIHPTHGVFKSYKANQRVKWTKTLVVDEISMASSELLGQMIERFEQAEHAPKLVLVGDLLQLPPVSGKFIYEHPLWEQIRIIKLTTIHRQKDPDFVDALNDLRVGAASDKVLKLVEERRVQALPPDCTLLFPHKAKVEDVNVRRLHALPGEESSFEWDVVQWRNPKKDEDDDAMLDQASSKARYPRVLTLKEGARVCMLNNDPNGSWVNGSTGEVVSFSEERVVVKLDRGYEVDVRSVNEEIFSSAGKEPDLTISQFPMMLAWALTTHKAQGMTLDRVGIDLDNHFACGMTYVALSRCKTKQGLYLVGSLSLVGADAKALQICA